VGIKVLCNSKKKRIDSVYEEDFEENEWIKERRGRSKTEKIS
jgi:hypothetical protein